MVIDSTKYQYLCPLCKKLGNVFVPYVEVDAQKIEVREIARQKAAMAYKKKLQSELVASGADSDIYEDKDKLPIAFKMDMTFLSKPSIPVFPTPSTLINTHTVNTKTTNPDTSNIWSWLTWIRHPSLLNYDLGVYSKVAHTSVSFHADCSLGSHNNALKRVRSATSDCTESEHVHTKPNMNTGGELDMAVSMEADEDPGHAGTFLSFCKWLSLLLLVNRMCMFSLQHILIFLFFNTFNIILSYYPNF